MAEQKSKAKDSEKRGDPMEVAMVAETVESKATLQENVLSQENKVAEVLVTTVERMATSQESAHKSLR